MEPLIIASRAGLAVLSLAVLICSLRLAIGPTLADRAVALDLIAVLLIGMLVLHGIVQEQPESLRVAIVLALLNFLSTIAFAIYMRRRFVND
jgi:multicomponent Na+:H+ antiporter subunit F